MNNAFCAKCNEVSLTPKSVSPEVADIGPQLGDIYICPTCGEVSYLTLQGWQAFTQDDFKNLTVDEACEIAFAVRVIRAKHAKPSP